MSTTDTQSTQTTSLDAARAAYANWRKVVEAELKGVPFEKKLVTRTAEGIALQPVYTRADAAGLPGLDSAPGEAPFLRGTSRGGYHEAPWDFAQELALGDAAGFNAALLSDLQRGQNSVVLSLDRAGRAGLDPDAAAAGADVGADGLSIADLDDLSAALDKVELTAVPVHIRAGATALPLAGLFAALAKKRGIDLAKINGSLTADPLGELAARGTLPAGIDALYDDLAAWTAWAAKNAPGLATVGVDAAVWLDGGGHAVQDLAFALAAGVEYVRALVRRGLAPAQIAPRLRFTFAVGPQFFMEIAKFRAFRLLWARAATAFGLEPGRTAAKVHARTARWNKTVLDINVNMLRTTTEALSAVLGGVNSLHIAPYDEVMGAPDEFSRRISRNIHTLLAEEFHFTAPNDPAGGSFYIEKLTDELARKAWALFQEVEKQGGFLAALKAGFPQGQVAEAAKGKFDGLDKRRIGLVGTNLFPNLKEKTPPARPSAAPGFAAARAKAVKARRSATMTLRLKFANFILEKIHHAEKEFDAAVHAAAQGATIGQLFAAIHSGGRPDAAVAPVAPRRASEGYEALRAASAAYAAKHGARPKVFVAKMGPVLQHKARTDFTAGFFATGGFELIAKESFETAEAAAQAAVASGAPIAVLASTDDTYPVLAPAFAKAVKAAKPAVKVILAGAPADDTLKAAYKEAGFDDFIHIRANVRGMLENFLKQIGAIE
ncbi:MAG: acyl-CoA mutase large subunit family protein [Opitutaceae bacterium]|jgi:methylmalonyl-CoA mutase|nr:acyl-CoA mutase large subunit family protein [Opitutaceae bacterium]